MLSELTGHLLTGYRYTLVGSGLAAEGSSSELAADERVSAAYRGQVIADAE